METMFYDEPSILSTTARKSMENNALKLTLCSDKMLDIGTKRDDLGFGDLADFLVSPDIGISSPDLENLVWKEWSASINTKPTGGTSDIQYTVKQEPCEIQETVTKEQEVFAYGFTEALKKLQETERQESEFQQENNVVPESSESSDSGSSDEVSSSPDNCDTKITFISYTFDTNERLPSFQEAFSKIIYKKSNDVCLQIKFGKREKCNSDQEQLKTDNIPQWSANSTDKNEISGYEWDNVETVDEGFCSREEIPAHLQENQYLEDPSLSMSWQTTENVEMTSDLFRGKSNEHIIDTFTNSNFDNNYEMDILEDHNSQKHWLSNQTSLHHIETSSGL